MPAGADSDGPGPGQLDLDCGGRDSESVAAGGRAGRPGPRAPSESVRRLAPRRPSPRCEKPGRPTARGPLSAGGGYSVGPTGCRRLVAAVAAGLAKAPPVGRGAPRSSCGRLPLSPHRPRVGGRYCRHTGRAWVVATVATLAARGWSPLAHCRRRPRQGRTGERDA